MGRRKPPSSGEGLVVLKVAGHGEVHGPSSDWAVESTGTAAIPERTSVDTGRMVAWSEGVALLGAQGPGVGSPPCCPGERTGRGPDRPEGMISTQSRGPRNAFLGWLIPKLPPTSSNLTVGAACVRLIGGPAGVRAALLGFRAVELPTTSPIHREHSGDLSPRWTRGCRDAGWSGR